MGPKERVDGGGGARWRGGRHEFTVNSAEAAPVLTSCLPSLPTVLSGLCSSDCPRKVTVSERHGHAGRGRVTPPRGPGHAPRGSRGVPWGKGLFLRRLPLEGRLPQPLLTPGGGGCPHHLHQAHLLLPQPHLLLPQPLPPPGCPPWGSGACRPRTGHAAQGQAYESSSELLNSVNIDLLSNGMFQQNMVTK